MPPSSHPASRSPAGPLPAPAADRPGPPEWFSENVHVHDASLRGYLRNAFPGVRDVDDVVQESYLRIWKARAAQPILSARAFLFKVAGHVAVDLLRRERVSPVRHLGDLSGVDVLADAPGVAEAVSLQEK